MPDPRPRPTTRTSHAGGFIIAIGVIGGAIAGLVLHQPTIGVLAGFAGSVGVAILIWQLDRRR